MPQKQRRPGAPEGARRAGRNFREQASSGPNYTRPLSRLQRAAAERMIVQQCRARAASAIHKLGPRVILELLTELGKATDEATVDAIADRFAAIDPAVLRFLGGDRFVPVPLRRVGGYE